MIKLYFVCMGNYYRSRLAEELALHYAAQKGIEIQADSGGLSKIPNPNNPGKIARATLDFLAYKNVQPQHANRMPKNCTREDMYDADIVVCTDKDEQKHLFLDQFPDYPGQLICWGARDQQYDPLLQTPFMIDKNIKQLIEELASK